MTVMQKHVFAMTARQFRDAYARTGDPRQIAKAVELEAKIAEFESNPP
jgi:hypothetical protein